MYLARFAPDSGEMVVAAIKWPAAGGALLPPGWAPILLNARDIDLAVRVVARPAGVDALLLASARKGAEGQLVEILGRLRRSAAPMGILEPRDSVEFDAMADGLPGWQVRVNQRHYRHGRRSLGCKFRLYATVSNRTGSSGFLYQVNVRRHRVNAETERSVRKALVGLEVDRPFTPAVREMQRDLLEGLLQPGWRAAEFLAFEDRISGEDWLRAVQSHFEATTGRLGFAGAPLERGDFADWFASGLYPSEELEGGVADLSGQAATLFSDDELPWLLSGAFLPSPTSPPALGSPSAVRPMVFISYASDDFAKALATCLALETAGWACWIAPRDIERSAMPYPEAIRQGLAQVAAVVVLTSAATNLSVHVPRELDLALARKLPIIPVRLQAIAPSGQLDYLLRTCQWLNAYGRDFVAAMSELLVRLSALPIATMGKGQAPAC